MSAGVDVAPVAAGDRAAFDAMMRDYLMEMAVILSQPPLHPYPYLDLYWSEPERWPFWILDRGRQVGFALVRRDAEENAFDMAEFFVTRSARRAGVGMRAARTIIARHPGPWRVRQRQANTNAIAFWHRALAVYAYQEQSTELRREQRFTVPAG